MGSRQSHLFAFPALAPWPRGLGTRPPTPTPDSSALSGPIEHFSNKDRPPVKRNSPTSPWKNRNVFTSWHIWQEKWSLPGSYMKSYSVSSSTEDNSHRKPRQVRTDVRMSEGFYFLPLAGLADLGRLNLLPLPTLPSGYTVLSSAFFPNPGKSPSPWTKSVILFFLLAYGYTSNKWISYCWVSCLFHLLLKRQHCNELYFPVEKSVSSYNKRRMGSCIFY